MCPASGDDDFLDWSLALQARLAFTAVGAMLDLKEPRFTIGVNVIRDRGTTCGNRRLQDFLYRGVQLAQFGGRKRVGAAARPDMRADQGFVGVYVSYAVEQLLVEQCPFDRRFAG